ncbi:hypothetical protein [Flavobacterium aquiphilum]|uniref:hypothetical protein n=1 Tax=Flavobacterium aquiphilum TaxID=3003261 RepID=UPI00248090D5|nr:hypothetical protein [Flavobacterium aquiphilum]
MNKISLKYFLFFIILSFTSCEEILYVEDISQNEVVLTAPANNVTLSFSSVTFSWEAVENAEKYHLQIATPNFTNAQKIVLDTIITKNSFTQQLNIGKYEWKVKAVNSAYETAYSARSFEILNNDDFQKNTVILLSPSSNLITKTPLQKLSWDPILGATNYQIQILDENNTLVKEQITDATLLNYTFDEGKFTWKVRATNGTVQTLYTSRSLLVDTKVPNTPTLSGPVNASSTTNTSIDFQWSRTPVAGSAEKDSIYVYSESSLTNLNFKDKATSPYNKTLASGTYYWFVKSFDEAGNESAKSTVFNFIIK